MKKWTNVCRFIISGFGTNGEINVPPLLTYSALPDTYACGIEYWELQGM